MGYIPTEDLVQNMTPEQRILVSQFYAKFDIGSGVPHKKIINVEPLLYMGALAGSEFVNYVVTKMYLCLSLVADHAEQETANEPHLFLYDESNIIFFTMANVAFTINGVGAVLAHFNTLELTNNYFSRVTTDPAQAINDIKFIGYRITLT